MTTIFRDLNGAPLDLTLAAGVATDVVIRCTNFRDASVQFRITGANPIGTCSVRLGNEGSTASDVLDAAASAAMVPITTTRLYERGVDTSFITFSLTSALGTTVRITPVPSGNASPGTTYVDGQAIASAAAGTGKVTIYDSTGTNAVGVEAAGADGIANNAVNMLSTFSRLLGYNGATWNRLRAGLTTPGTLTGILNSLVWAVFNASPTVRTEGQGGPLQGDSLGSLNATLATAISGEDSTNNLMAVLDKPTVSTTYAWTRFTNFSADVTKNVKASAGQVFSVYMHNLSGATRYFQLHNTATTPGAGVAPAFTFLVPAGGALIVDSAFFGKNGANFALGIAFACSTTEATYTAGVAGDHVTQIMYA